MLGKINSLKRTLTEKLPKKFSGILDEEKEKEKENDKSYLDNFIKGDEKFSKISSFFQKEIAKI